MENGNRIGKNISLFRKKAGWTQSQIAVKLNLSKTVISNYETGLKLPSADTLIGLASLFNVSLDTLVGRDKVETITVDGLSAGQIDILRTLVLEFANPNKESEISKRQLYIIMGLGREFYNNRE